MKHHVAVSFVPEIDTKSSSGARYCKIESRIQHTKGHIGKNYFIVVKKQYMYRIKILSIFYYFCTVTDLQESMSQRQLVKFCKSNFQTFILVSCWSDTQLQLQFCLPVPVLLSETLDMFICVSYVLKLEHFPYIFISEFLCFEN